MEGAGVVGATPRNAGAVKQAVEAVLPLVAGRVEDIERAGRLPHDVVDALRRTGVHRLTVPAVLGGLQAPVADMLDAIERLATVDGSTAWCTVIAVGSNIFSGYVAERAAKVIFADPDQGNGTMFGPTGKITVDGGGYRLNGRWAFTSNCLHSGWLGLGACVQGPDGVVVPVPRVAFVPATDVTIEDTWRSVGLRGTGSHHVAALDVPVEPDACCTFADRAWPEGTLWRVPIYSVLVPLLTAVPLGIARGALDELGRQAREGRTARRGQLGDDPMSVAELAAADARLRAARAGLWAGVSEIHGLTERGEPVGRVPQAQVFLAALHATDVAVEVTSVAHNLGGGASAYLGSRLLRALCDVEAGRQHLLFAHKHRIELGRILVGLDVAYPPFIL
jgi:alkylation response protein AidB-like acyl-CoA dehydrogenase